jgi:hypothetical protein
LLRAYGIWVEINHYPANAKIAGDHFIHIDKVRQNTPDQTGKEELIKILNDWFDNNSIDKTIAHELNEPAKNLTDTIIIKR